MRNRAFRPGLDRRAVRHPAPTGAPRVAGRRVVVIGGGIAGLSAAVALAERGVRVDLFERAATFGGRARSWPLADDRTMSRGFHAFFRQYYNLRAVLRRADPALQRLTPVADYPLLLAGGTRDSFARLPRRPPWNVGAFVLTSPSFPLAALTRVDVGTALELVRARFPETADRYDDLSAAEFLNRLHFPTQARHLALEVFSRSFFAPADNFSAGEMIAMFHAYFTGSAEGLLFDVPDDDYDAALWAPLVGYLRGLGVRCHADTTIDSVQLGDGQVAGVRVRAGGASLDADAAVVATDPRSARALLSRVTGPAAGWSTWRDRIGGLRNAPPFVVGRMWLDRPAPPELPTFLGTSGFDGLDNVSVVSRFERGAARWADEHGGSVVELHAYAVAESEEGGLRRRLGRALTRIAPQLTSASVVHEQWLWHDDCPLLAPGDLSARPRAASPDPRLVLAGDWLRTDEPVALMERAATTGLRAANALLAQWGVAGHDIWTVPLRGVLGGRQPGAVTA